MPYKRVGKAVFKGGKKVGASKTLAKAKAFMRTMLAIEHGWKPTKKKKK